MSQSNVISEHVAHLDPSARDFDEQLKAAMRRAVAAIRFTDVAPQTAIDTVVNAGIRLVT